MGVIFEPEQTWGPIACVRVCICACGFDGGRGRPMDAPPSTHPPLEKQTTCNNNRSRRNSCARAGARATTTAGAGATTTTRSPRPRARTSSRSPRPRVGICVCVCVFGCICVWVCGWIGWTDGMCVFGCVFVDVWVDGLDECAKAAGWPPTPIDQIHTHTSAQPIGLTPTTTPNRTNLCTNQQTGSDMSRGSSNPKTVEAIKQITFLLQVCNRT